MIGLDRKIWMFVVLVFFFYCFMIYGFGEWLVSVCIIYIVDNNIIYRFIWVLLCEVLILGV